MYRRSRRAASCGMVDSVAKIEVSGVSCYIVVSNSIPVLAPRAWGSDGYRMGKVEHEDWQGRWGSGSYEVGKSEHGKNLR